MGKYLNPKAVAAGASWLSKTNISLKLINAIAADSDAAEEPAFAAKRPKGPGALKDFSAW